MNKPQVFTDGLQSMLAGLGTARDKATSVTFSEVTVDENQLVLAYRTSWLARKIVEIPAFDSMREWREWQAQKNEIELIEAEEKRLQLQQKLLRARIMARLFGVAFLYFDLGDDQSRPVVPERTKKKGIRFLTVLTHRQLIAGDFDQDPLSPTFGQPQWYSVVGSTSGEVRIHPSRIIRLVGNARPDVEFSGLQNEDSVLVSLMQSVKHFDGTSDNIASLVYEAKIDVISVKGLMQLAGNPYEEQKLLARYRLAATAKGNNGMLLLDGDTETYEQKNSSFQHLADILDRFAQNSSGGADIPMTRLFGQSPGGMNASGDSDIRNYYDRISADQRLVLQPALADLDEVLIYSALGVRPAEVHYKWNSLWQVTNKERADLGTAGANMVKTLKDTGLIPDEVLADSAVALLTQDGAMPGLEGAYTDYFEEEGSKDDFFAEEEPPEMPPPGGGGNPADFQDEQPRAPKGSPNGGQWVKQGGGSGAADKAASKVATSKYSAEQVKALTSKNKEDLTHYEKKVLAKYKKALSEEQAAANAQPLGLRVSMPPPPGSTKSASEIAADKQYAEAMNPGAAAAKQAALASVATAKYPADKIESLLSKDYKDLTMYEKKKLAAYKKALEAGKSGTAAKSALPKLGTAETTAALTSIKNAAGAPSGMKMDTVEKLASGEWKPDPSKPYQAKIAAQGSEYLKTGKQPPVVTLGTSGATPKNLALSLQNSPPPITDFSAPQTTYASVSGLTGSEQSAATKYTGSTYHAINDALRSNGTHSLVSSLDGAIAKSAAKTDMVVVRGVSSGGMNKWLAASGGQLKVGSVITDKGFVSTTRKASVASLFAGGSSGYGLKINIKEGSKILPLKSISNYAHEDEFLLPRGSSFKITGFNPDTKVITVDLVKS